MPLTKQEKQNILKELEDRIERQKAMFFLSVQGVKVGDLSLLRKNLKAKENELKVAKKTLLKIALKNKGIDIDPEIFEGELALAFAFKDELSPAKIIYDFSKKNDKVKILGAFFEKEMKNAEDVVALAEIPSYEELLRRFVYTLNSPISKFVNVLESNIKGLIVALNAIANK